MIILRWWNSSLIKRCQVFIVNTIFSWSTCSTTVCSITICVWIQMWIMTNIYWFSMFMYWFFIIIIFSVTCTLLILFVGSIIVCVILLYVCFILWCFIIIVFISSWNWLVLFGRSIIIRVILRFVWFSLFNIWLNLLSEYISFGNIYFIGWFICVLRVGLLL